MPSPSKSISLYEVAAEGQFIQDCIIDAEGELLPEVEERLNALMIAGPDKLQAASHVLLNLETAAEACNAEAYRLKERAKTFEAGIEKLKSRMTAAIDLAFNGKVKTDTVTLWTQKAGDSYSVELAQEVSLEQLQKECPSFVRTKLELDRRAVQDAYNAEQPLPDSIFVIKTPGKRYLRIK